MIDGFNLTKDLITFEKGFDKWEDAIKASSVGLLEQGFITESYVESMINSVKEYGPYIVIAPNFAMPHARPEAGSKKIGFSVMLCEEPVKFSDAPEHEARLFVTLSCVSSDTHLQMIQALVEVLGDEVKFNGLLNAKTKDEILTIFQ